MAISYLNYSAQCYQCGYLTFNFTAQRYQHGYLVFKFLCAVLPTWLSHI